MAYNGNSSKIVSSSFLYSTLQTFYTKIKGLLDGKANTSHTHNYAGSSSAGGAATDADKLDGYHASSFCLNEKRNPQPATFFENWFIGVDGGLGIVKTRDYV